MQGSVSITEVYKSLGHNHTQPKKKKKNPGKFYPVSSQPRQLTFSMKLSRQMTTSHGLKHDRQAKLQLYCIFTCNYTLLVSKTVIPGSENAAMKFKVFICITLMFCYLQTMSQLNAHLFFSSFSTVISIVHPFNDVKSHTLPAQRIFSECTDGAQIVLYLTGCWGHTREEAVCTSIWALTGAYTEQTGFWALLCCASFRWDMSFKQ